MVVSAVTEDRERSSLAGTEGGGDERVARANHLVARADVQTTQSHMQGGSAVGDADGIAYAQPFRPGLLKLLADGTSPIIDLSTTQDIGDLLDGGFLKLRPGWEL